MAGYLRVKNFDRFQHYKDRNPPWIKLYYDVLTDYRFACLQDASKLHLVLIWLLASRTDNRIPDDPRWVARSIHATDTVDLDCLVSSGFLERCDTVGENLNGASRTQADRKQPAMPETETETETEKGPKGPLPADAGVADQARDRSPKAHAGSQPAAAKADPKPRRARKAANDHPGPEHAEVRAYFRERWKDRRSADGSDYAWKYGRDDGHLRWVLDQCGRDPDKARGIVKAFIDDDDPWLAEKGHEIALLVSRFNRYRAKGNLGNGNGAATEPGYDPWNPPPVGTGRERISALGREMKKHGNE